MVVFIIDNRLDYYGILTHEIPIEGEFFQPEVVDVRLTSPPSLLPAPVELLFLTSSNHKVIGAFLSVEEKIC